MFRRHVLPALLGVTLAALLVSLIPAGPGEIPGILDLLGVTP